MTAALPFKTLDRLPPHLFFFVSAVFHYLGPAFAVLLMANVPVLGVAWLRIATAALVFAVWRRPWRMFMQQTWTQRRLTGRLGAVLALMNTFFYLAISRLPLATVGAIEFIGPIVLAAIGVRSRRNALALVLAIAGGWLLTEVRLEGQPLGYFFAIANCLFFVLYIVLGHQVSQAGGKEGVDQLATAMLFALIVVTPIGLKEALAVLPQPGLVLAGAGVGICSSVIPYVCDQLAMARLPRATFALLLALLPVSAVIIGAIALQQFPAFKELLGIALIAAAVAFHQR